jgi:hypothetical protein
MGVLGFCWKVMKVVFIYLIFLCSNCDGGFGNPKEDYSIRMDKFSRAKTKLLIRINNEIRELTIFDAFNIGLIDPFCSDFIMHKTGETFTYPNEVVIKKLKEEDYTTIIKICNKEGSDCNDDDGDGYDSNDKLDCNDKENPSDKSCDHINDDDDDFDYKNNKENVKGESSSFILPEESDSDTIIIVPDDPTKEYISIDGKEEELINLDFDYYINKYSYLKKRKLGSCITIVIGTTNPIDAVRTANSNTEKLKNWDFESYIDEMYYK